jgi:hypothetical protein
LVSGVSIDDALGTCVSNHIVVDDAYTFGREVTYQPAMTTEMISGAMSRMRCRENVSR